MQKATINNLFNIEVLPYTVLGEANHAPQHRALYQQVASEIIKPLTNTQVFVQIANRLIRIAEQALDLRQTPILEQISQVLMNAPLPRQYQSIGEYYRGFVLKRRGAIKESCGEFERLAESPTLPPTFRTRALQALGAIYFDQGRLDNALYSFSLATRAATRNGDLLARVNAQWMIAVNKSLDGDHANAMADLEGMVPIVRLLASDRPYYYYNHANSLAVELLELGRQEEALRLSQIALRSPFASYYPEWHETKAEILEKMRRASPSTVAGVAWPKESDNVAVLPVAPNNVLTMPVAARPAVSLDAGAAPSEPARVIAYHGWQQPTPDAPDALPEQFTHEDLNRMSIHDKQAALLDVIYSDDVTHETLDPLLIAAGKVTADAPAS